MIIGPPGSGKTTFALQLAQKLKVPLYHLDRLMFLPGDIKRDQSEFIQLQRELVQKPEWIIEGCGTRSFEVRFARAKLLIVLETPRLICIWRAFYRVLFKAKKMPDTPEGCKKVFHFEMIQYIWAFKNKFKPLCTKYQKLYPDVQVIRLRNSKQIELFISKSTDL